MSMGLDLNFDFNDSMDNLGATFRAEGMSVAYDKLRVDGHNVELKVRYEDLDVGKRIGQGACSMVNRAKHKETGEMYAVKLFNVYDKGQRSQMLKEISMLLEIDCPSLIKLQGVFHSDGNIGLILEYMNVGSLDGSLFTKFINVSHGHAKVPVLQIPGTYNPNSSVGAKGVNHLELVLSCITYQVLWGLAYLHYEHNTHRDIKPGNILINYDGEVKLSDFGISRNLDNTVGMSNTAVGTCKYMSPERLEGLAYNETADIYAFGMVMLEIINNNCYPFGRGGGSAGSGGGMFDDGDDGGIMSPIELLAELETLDVNRLLDNYILPNINGKGGGGRICITEQLREFITGMMHYESNDRSSALELLNSSKLFKFYEITDLETAQGILRGYITQHIPLDNLSQPTPNSARSQLAAHLPPGNYTNYGTSGGGAAAGGGVRHTRGSSGGKRGPASPADCDRETPRNNFNEYDQQNASMQRGDSEKLRGKSSGHATSGHSRHPTTDYDDFYDDDQFYEDDFESNQLSDSVTAMSVHSSISSPYGSSAARERSAKMKRELSNQSTDSYSEEQIKSTHSRRNAKATRQYSDDDPYESKCGRK